MRGWRRKESREWEGEEGKAVVRLVVHKSLIGSVRKFHVILPRVNYA